MNTLDAGRAVLEPQKASHAAEMVHVLADQAIYEFENAPPVSLAWLESRFAKLEAQYSADGTEQWLNWVIRLPSGELAGYVQASVTQESTAYIAYELASKFWRQGIGSSAVTAMLIELENTYSVRCFVAVFKARNFRSMALLRSLGFDCEPPVQLTAVERGADEAVMYKPSLFYKNLYA